MSEQSTPSPISVLDLMPEKWLRKVPDHPEIAYAIIDPAFPDFYVKKSTNAWWEDPLKVKRLIDAYKMRMTDFRACVYAGISESQLRYFKDMHPEFSLVKQRARETASIIAHQTVFNDLTDVRTAKWWLGETFKDDRQEGVNPAGGGTMVEETKRVFYDDDGKPTYSEDTMRAIQLMEKKDEA